MKKAVLLFGIIFLSIQLNAQEYPVATDPSDILNKSTVAGFSSDLAVAQPDTTNDLLGDISAADNQAEPLLPEHMIFTQRMLWGNKGLMRNFDYFKLTPEKRARELNVRRVMLTTHQIIGYATLAGMIAQGIVGSNLFDYSVNGKEGDSQKTKDLHEGLATAINIGYFTGAGLALFTPPKMLDDKKGYSSIKVHMGLAIVHLTGMVATNILADQIETAKEKGDYALSKDLKVYHRAAAFTAFGSFAAAMIIIKF